ncbi:hypothetical protein HZA98_02565 [Candidatus Woesearchaeota archaeon]|nr:hypothetical protein [Candidatus Woesearchaeota archaeon]
MRIRLLRILGSLFFFSLLSLVFVQALVISPAKVIISYTPDETQSFDITLQNDISEDIVVQMSYESYEGKIDYSSYFSNDGYGSNKIQIPAGQSKTVRFHMKYPPLEKFGDIRFAFIRFYQVPLAATGNVGATVAILIPLETSVPYPEKYISGDISPLGVVKAGDIVSLNASLRNDGLNVLQDVEGNFEISRVGYEKTIPIEPLSLFLQKESVFVSKDFDTSSLSSGVYNVSLHLTYDGENRDLEPVPLIIASREISILSLDPVQFIENSSSTVRLGLQNMWVEEINTPVTLELLSSEGTSLKTFDAGSYVLPVGKAYDITAPLDLAGYSSGDYVLKVHAAVDGSDVSKSFPVKIVTLEKVLAAAPAETSSLLYVLGIILVVVLLLGIAAYLAYKKSQSL